MLASHEANPILNRTVFRSVDVRPVFCFLPKIKLFSVFIWINTCDAYIVISLIKDIYLMSTVLLINQVSKNMILINTYFASIKWKNMEGRYCHHSRDRMRP